MNQLIEERRETGAQPPPLPHWESTPADLKDATRQIKSAIRQRIEASGRTVEEVFAVLEERVTRRVEEIEAVLEARFDIAHTTLQVDHDASEALIELRR